MIRGMEYAPVVEAQRDDAGDVVEGDLGAVLQGDQRLGGTVDHHVAPDAVHLQQRADLRGVRWGVMSWVSQCTQPDDLEC
jgi:hypothetical protein